MDDPVQIERIGVKVSEEMRGNILYIFYESCEQKEFSSQSDYIKNKLDQTYGPHWIVFMWDIDTNVHYSYYNHEQYMFEFYYNHLHVLIMKWDVKKLQETKPE